LPKLSSDRRRGDDLVRARRADARQQLRDAEAGDPVARVGGEAQQRQRILDMGGNRETSARRT